MDAVVSGCTECEMEPCGDSIGFGGHVDETGHASLDALVIDGYSHVVLVNSDLRLLRGSISKFKWFFRQEFTSI